MFTSFYYPNARGGAEEVARTLAEGMTNLGHQVTIVTLSDSKLIAENIHGVSVIRLPLRNFYWPSDDVNHKYLKPFWHILDTYNLFMLSSIKYVLEVIKPDVVHTHTISGFSPLVWRVARDLNIPVVHTLHDHYILCSRTAMFKNGVACKTRCLDCSCFSVPKVSATKNVSTVIGVSNYILEKHLEFSAFLDANKEVIYNPIDRPVEIKDFSKSSRLTIGFIGSLYAQKGIHVFLSLANRIKQWNFVIAGSGDNEITSKIERQVKDSVNLTYLGRSTREDFYNKIDILYVPSLWREAAGRVIMEAYSYGKPVIGSNVGGIPESIVVGETGYVVHPRHEEEVISKIDCIARSYT
ncbi:glycosyltransferase family 4 protein, partial [Deinococcus wulumuqiensis]|uniref:glycosyltransferase family 4 protein n=1 Tax=Deinococcus wulumuqiensis TaxID=980427 RepID=UPI00242B438D